MNIKNTLFMFLKMQNLIFISNLRGLTGERSRFIKTISKTLLKRVYKFQ